MNSVRFSRLRTPYVRLLSATTLIGAMLAGCSQPVAPQADVTVSPPTVTVLDPAAVDRAEKLDRRLDALARSLAIAVTQRPVRDTIREGLNRRFDGDQNVLLRDLTAQTAFRTALASAASSAGVGGGGLGSAGLSALNADYETLQVAYSDSLDTWDPATTPLVAYIPVSTDDEVSGITGYDAKGNSYHFTQDQLPDVPVLIVGLNERLDLDGQLIEGLMTSQNVCADCDPGGGSGGGSGTGGGTGGGGTGPYIDGLAWLVVTDDHEPWWRGGPEVQLQINSQTDPATSFYRGRFDQRQGVFRTYNRGLFYWSTAYGDFVGHKWTELDGGFAINVSYTFRGVNLSFRLQDSDDDMGFVAITRDEPIRTIDTGSVRYSRFRQ